MKVPYTVIVQTTPDSQARALPAVLDADGTIAINEAVRQFEPDHIVGLFKGDLASTWVAAPKVSE